MPAIVYTSPSGPSQQTLDHPTTTQSSRQALLRELLASDLVNDSLVSGPSLADALNTLLAGQGGGAVGSISESFAGGNSLSLTATNTNANVGDNGWNYLVAAPSAGNSCAKIPGEPNAVGIYRLTSPTAIFIQATLYLGGAVVGVFATDGWASCTFRVRVDNVQAANEICTWGVTSAAGVLLGTGETAGFFSILAGPGASPNYQTRTSHLSAGNTAKNTGVPIDALFHDFQIVRVSATQLDFYIDGVLRTTHSVALGDGMPAGPMIPFFGAVGGGASTFLDADDFSYVPL